MTTSRQEDASAEELTIKRPRTWPRAVALAGSPRFVIAPSGLGTVGSCNGGAGVFWAMPVSRPGLCA